MRLWPAFACLLLLAMVGRRPIPSTGQYVLECWERNLAKGQDTCYLCGANLGYVNEQTLYLDAKYRAGRDRWVPAYIGICEGCAARYGWPLPISQQNQAVKHWKVVEYQYFGPLYQTAPDVWERRRKQIDSAQVTASTE